MSVSKNIVITGGTDGIGLAIAKKLSKIDEILTENMVGKGKFALALDPGP
mgnify:CR=1 FL=1